jgi:hypothetical protein
MSSFADQLRATTPNSVEHVKARCVAAKNLGMREIILDRDVEPHVVEELRREPNCLRDSDYQDNYRTSYRTGWRVYW